MGVHEHKKTAPTSVACALITISDTRTADSDTTGAEIRARLEAAGHRIVSAEIIPDDPDRIAASVKRLAADEEVDAVVTNGGTGVSPRDNTYEAVAALLTRRLDGFGELFRYLSYEEVGSAAMLSRALGGIVGRTVVFALPGSRAAGVLALERLILPELGHVVALANPSAGQGGGT